MGFTFNALLQKQRSKCKIDCVEGISKNKLTTFLTCVALFRVYCCWGLDRVSGRQFKNNISDMCTGSFSGQL